MARSRFTKRARNDLSHIWDYIAPSDLGAADHVLDRIERVCRVLGDQPELGRVRPDIFPGIRSIASLRWVIFYRVVGETPQILRIIDGARDFSRMNWSDELF